MSAAKSLDYVHQRPTNPVQVHTESENYPKLHHVCFVYKYDKHGFRSEIEKIDLLWFCNRLTLNLYIWTKINCNLDD